MIPRSAIPFPQGIREEILRAQRMVEYYCEPSMPGFREYWNYLLLVEDYDDRYVHHGAGVVCNREHGLVQTFSFSSAEIMALREELAAMSICAFPPGVSMLDGNHGCIRIYQGGGTFLEIQWGGRPPDEWQPMLEWIGRVWKLIEDKAFDDSFDQAPSPSA